MVLTLFRVLGLLVTSVPAAKGSLRVGVWESGELQEAVTKAFLKSQVIAFL